MERLYYNINEENAKAANDAVYSREYVAGSATQAYKQNVDRVYDIVDLITAEKPELSEKAVGMAERYSRKLAEYYNNYYRNETSCPSVLISGGANFPVKKKEKQNSRRETLMKDWDDLQSFAQKIENLLTMKQPILSNDENAIDRLEEKLDRLEALQSMMKSVNAYYRKNKTLDNCPDLTLKQIQELKLEMKEHFHYEDKPFMTYALTNNNATIKNTRARLERLKKEKEAGTQAHESKFFTIVENTELMRLQLIFDEKPKEEVRSILRGNAFKWSPKNNCWQRQLTNNARYAVRNVISALEKLDSLK